MADGDFGRDNRENLDQFATYEDYLDSLVTEEDRYYLEDDELARQLVAIGGRKGDVLSKEEFLAKKEASGQQKMARNQMTTKSLAASGTNFINQPFLTQLVAREELVRGGKWQLLFLFVIVTRKVMKYLDILISLTD